MFLCFCIRCEIKILVRKPLLNWSHTVLIFLLTTARSRSVKYLSKVIPKIYFEPLFQFRTEEFNRDLENNILSKIKAKYPILILNFCLRLKFIPQLWNWTISSSNFLFKLNIIPNLVWHAMLVHLVNNGWCKSKSIDINTLFLPLIFPHIWCPVKNMVQQTIRMFE